MAFPGSNMDNVLTKISAATMALQSLIAQLKENGTLAEGDIDKMQARAMEYAAMLKEHGGSGAQVAGARIEQDLFLFFDIIKND
ncbi:hypothetical protein ACELLULO517_28155 [Acidisoma cellulosilytica]|uniref:Uncharacterized protein n=1 Tax=Acidisoma cellulosilyticum TaxID=2802395 RepID=A0A964E7L0_9PROT|nr:hypothetical protein [Acidisoma cellulosilyticum]MCB8884118.1 hypothetical protein [Acidisoma cellulosilyticum]